MGGDGGAEDEEGGRKKTRGTDRERGGQSLAKGYTPIGYGLCGGARVDGREGPVVTSGSAATDVKYGRVDRTTPSRVDTVGYSIATG